MRFTLPHCIYKKSPIFYVVMGMLYMLLSPHWIVSIIGFCGVCWAAYVHTARLK